MKRIILVTALFCFLAGQAIAQEDGYFNHLSAGLSLGSGGVGIQMAAPMGSSFQLRAGYSIFPPLSFSKTVTVPEHPGASGSGKGANIPVDAKATMNLSDAELLVDFFPGGHEWFHFTAGVLYGPASVINVTNTSPLPEDYNTVGLDVDGFTVKAINNYINGYIGAGTLRPYAGIGFGRAVKPDRPVTFTFDFGAMFWGKPGLFAPGEPLIGDWQDVRITSASLNGRDEGLIELAEKLVVYPMLNMHVFIKLF